MHADGCQLFDGSASVFSLALNPNTGHSLFAVRFNSEIRGGANHHFFELPHIPCNVTANRSEIQDRITDNLSRTVIGDVSTAIRGMEVDVHLAEQMLRREKIFLMAIAPKRDDVRMLAEKQNIRHRASFARND